MKTYTVIRNRDSQIGVTVTETNISGNTRTYLLPHCVYHSPTGMETGYGGSGPADLALSILADYFGVTAIKIKAIRDKALGFMDHNNSHRPLKLHQNFKFDVIAGRRIETGESYQITGDEICEWLKSQPEAE